MATTDTRKRSSEGLGMGGPIGITLYGMIAVFASALFDEELIPADNLQAVGLLAAAFVVGAVLGAAFDRRPRRG
jgi:hypothetical protein